MRLEGSSPNCLLVRSSNRLGEPSSPEKGCMTVDQLGAPRQKLGHGNELFGIEFLQQCGNIVSQWANCAVDR